MKLYAGIAAPLNCSSIRIVDAKGGIAKEAKVLSEPEARPGFSGAGHGRLGAGRSRGKALLIV